MPATNWATGPPAGRSTNPTGDPLEPKTKTNLSALTVADEPITPSAPPARAGRLKWAADLLAGQPVWVQVAFAVGMMLLGALTDRTCNHRPAPAPVTLTVQPVAPAEPVSVQAAGDVGERNREAREGRKWFAKVIRARAAKELQRDGFKLVGGPEKPLDERAAWALVAKLDDDALVAAAKQTGAIGDGSVLDRLGSVLQWIVDHQEQIVAVIKIVLTILMAFGDPVALDVVAAPDGSLWVVAVYPDFTVLESVT